MYCHLSGRDHLAMVVLLMAFRLYSRRGRVACTSDLLCKIRIHAVQGDQKTTIMNPQPSQLLPSFISCISSSACVKEKRTASWPNRLERMAKEVPLRLPVGGRCHRVRIQTLSPSLPACTWSHTTSRADYTRPTICSRYQCESWVYVKYVKVAMLQVTVIS